MKQISRRTNPTDLKEVDRVNFMLRVADDVKTGREFWLERFDYKAAGLPSEAMMSCVASAGSTEQYFSLGPVATFNRGVFAINELARDKPLRFRFVFNLPGETRLIGFSDGVRPVDEAGDLGGSLVDIYPTDLQGPAWLLDLPLGDDPEGKPCLMVERSIFPTAQAAVAHPWFVTLVMPEVMRQIAEMVAGNLGALDDDGSWMGAWKNYFENLGLPDEADGEAPGDWAATAARQFARSAPLLHQFDRVIAEMRGEQE